MSRRSLSSSRRYKPFFGLHAPSSHLPVLGRAALLAASIGGVGLPLARAQEAVQVQPEVDNSRFTFAGQVNAAGVYVRSGPGDAYYATGRLDKGTAVTVVGIKLDWLKIKPPQDSFCYVSKLYVERRGDGTIGRVIKPEINVRAGSSLNEMKTTVLAHLNVGDDVKIVGERDEYYKITPPDGCYLYVNKEFVDPVKALAASPTATADATPAADVSATGPAAEPKAGSAQLMAADATPASPAAAPAAATAQPTATSTPPSQSPSTEPSSAVADAGQGAPTTMPSGSPGKNATAAAAPAAPDPKELAQKAADSFHTLETDFTTASAMPLDQQPAKDLADRYSTLLQTPGLTADMTRTAEFRLAVLNVRVDGQRRLEEVRKSEEAAAAQALALNAEKQELQQRLDAEKVDTYTAVGQLEASSLQFGADTLYRLTDPASGRTVVYLRDTDPKVAKLIGTFVGVRGQVSTDERLSLKVIPASEIAAVDARDVNTKVQAEILPASLMTHSSQASTGNQ